VAAAQHSKPIAVTMGEPAGVGGEIALKTWIHRDRDTPAFFIIDDAKRLESIAGTLGISAQIKNIATPEECGPVFHSALPVLPLESGLAEIPELGSPSPNCASSVIGSIEQAVRLVQCNQACAIVTNPIQKSVLREASFPHPGHTEFLGHLSGVDRPVMMLVIEGLRVVPVTVHVAIKDVAQALSTDAIVHCAKVSAHALKTDFGVSNPRLAIAALNPHAGEKGHMGDEEAHIITPAISLLKEIGIDVFGPAAADTLFHESARQSFDAAICMYHDQALIPLKTLNFSQGVNVTLGLPFVRTSPDHGTACDIAPFGTADHSSFAAAIHTAKSMADSRIKVGAVNG